MTHKGIYFLSIGHQKLFCLVVIRAFGFGELVIHTSCRRSHADGLVIGTKSVLTILYEAKKLLLQTLPLWSVGCWWEADRQVFNWDWLIKARDGYPHIFKRWLKINTFLLFRSSNWSWKKENIKLPSQKKNILNFCYILKCFLIIY